MNLYTYTYVFIYIYVCIYIHIRMYLYTYTHAFMNIYTHPSNPPEGRASVYQMETVAMIPMVNIQWESTTTGSMVKLDLPRF